MKFAINTLVQLPGSKHQHVYVGHNLIRRVGVARVTICDESLLQPITDDDFKPSGKLSRFALKRPDQEPEELAASKRALVYHDAH